MELQPHPYSPIPPVLPPETLLPDRRAGGSRRVDPDRATAADPQDCRRVFPRELAADAAMRDRERHFPAEAFAKMVEQNLLP